MAEAAASAVKHDDDLTRLINLKQPGKRAIHDVLRADDLHLEIMVAGAQCSQLFQSTLDRSLADLRGIGAGDAAAFLVNSRSSSHPRPCSTHQRAPRSHTFLNSERETLSSPVVPTPAGT